MIQIYGNIETFCELDISSSKWIPQNVAVWRVLINESFLRLSCPRLCDIERGWAASPPSTPFLGGSKRPKASYILYSQWRWSATQERNKLWMLLNWRAPALPHPACTFAYIHVYVQSIHWARPEICWRWLICSVCTNLPSIINTTLTATRASESELTRQHAPLFLLITHPSAALTSH